MKLLIVAGGGGHFAPALAVIEALPKDVDVIVIGRRYAFEADKTESLEYLTAKKLGIPFVPLTTGRLQRRFTRYSLVSLAKVPVGYFQALKVLKDFRPDVVLSFGGYVSVPVAFAAKTLGVPIVVHEQILSAGLANKIAAKFAEKVCVSWKESAKFFPREKVVITGNPMRHSGEERSSDSRIRTITAVRDSALLRGSSRQARMTKEIIDAGLPVIYVTGGSGGAHGINILIEDCLEKLLEKYTVVHQTGDAKEYGDFDRLEKLKNGFSPELQKRYIVTKFVDTSDVFSIMTKADLVVSRAGINTITELLTLGKPCLLIPLPYGQHNEQPANAMFVKQLGIAETANQHDLTGEKLYSLITKMLEQLKIYQENSSRAKEEVITDATAKVIDVVNNVNAKKKIT